MFEDRVIACHIANLLDRGELDLAIGAFPRRGERFSRLSLLEDDFVGILRKGHPATKSRELSTEKFAALSHLAISSVAYNTDFIDQALARCRLKAPDSIARPILVGSAYFGRFGYGVGAPTTRCRGVRYRSLVIRRLAHSSPTSEIAMIWLRWLDNQLAHRWLGETVTVVSSGFFRQLNGWGSNMPCSRI